MENALKYFRRRCKDLKMCLTTSLDREQLEKVIKHNEKAVEVLEKQIPKGVKNRKILRDFNKTPYTIRGDCPICGSAGLLASNTDYCNACGQKLKWDVDNLKD